VAFFSPSTELPREDCDKTNIFSFQILSNSSFITHLFIHPCVVSDTDRVLKEATNEGYNITKPQA
jgi:hypothetical protein